jgi:DNA-binding NarL/FixJ family response regulator
MAADADVEQEFEEALRWHAQTPTPFERARTELCFGERLRRMRRTVEARRQLRNALDTFTRLGAKPWAERALSELRASGEAVRGQTTVADGRLTPQELQVALLVAEGATNREAAEALFLSTKTIEFHLRSVYRKLNLRSRTELAYLAGQVRLPQPAARA